MLNAITQGILGSIPASFARLWAIRSDISLEFLAASFRRMEDAVRAGSDVTPVAAKPFVKGAAPGKKVAVIPIEGVLTRTGPSWWGSNYDTIARAVTEAAGNADIGHIVLAVDSPGGEVPGTLETGNAIAEAAKVKPVTAMVEGMAASAAYWLASQARDIVLTPSGSVGSVGVKTMHADISKALDNEGVKVTEMYAGDHKTEFSQYKPLSEEAMAEAKKKLDEAHQQFIGAVSQGRGNRASQEMQSKRFGEGRMFTASDAVSHGLADKIQTRREFFSSLLSRQEAAAAGQGGNSVIPFRLELDRAKVEASL